MRLQADAADGSTFHRDLFVDGGAVSGVNVLLSGGRNHRFDETTFVMRESGYALQVRLAASGTVVSNAIFYGEGLVQMDDGTGLKLAGNLYWGTGRTDAWARVDGPRRLFGKDYLLARDGSGIAADPLFADPAHDDFSLRASSPASELGALPLAGGSTEPEPTPEPAPEEPAPQPPAPVEGAPAGWEGALAVVGTGVADTLEGTAQSEWIRGLEGPDVLKGKAGADALFGDNGGDTLLGGDGDDLLAGGAGDDVMKGGSGRDTAWYGDAPGPVKVDLKISGAQATGHGQDSLGGIENLAGSDHADRLLGTGGDNILDGSGGDDTLTGRHGSDTLLGGTGNDWLSGGGGADIFVFAPGDGRDTIADLRPGDRIELASPALETFADVLDRASDSAAGAVLDLGNGDALVLEGVQVEDLAADYFLL